MVPQASATASSLTWAIVEMEALIAAVERENRSVGRIAAGALERDVPHCPGWDVALLLRHLGAVHRWAAGIVRTPGLSVRPRRENEPAEPADPVELLAWFDEGVTEVVAALREADPEATTYALVGARPMSWWARRQALEAAIHRVDVEQAVGTERPEVDAELAVTGVDEMFEVFSQFARLPPELGAEGRTLHLHATDRDGEWLVRLHAGGIEASHGHAKGDAALRGTASDLLLFVWGRLPAERLELFGDPEVPAIYARHTSL